MSAATTIGGRFADAGTAALLRIVDTPAVTWLATAAVSVLVAIGQDPFTWALGMLAVASIMDYATGVATARAVPPGKRGAYDPERAARGRREKIITVMLMIGCRMLEGLATAFGILNIAGVLRWLGAEQLAASPAIHQGGILATAVTILIAVEELSSVYDHRLANGGSRILLLEFAFSSVRAAQRFVLGKAASKVAAWADGAAETYAGTLAAGRRIDETLHREQHGSPAPRRRHGDEALDELRDADLPQGGRDAPPPGHGAAD